MHVLFMYICMYVCMYVARVYSASNHKEGWRGNRGHRRCRSLRGRRVRSAPSDFDKEERAKKKVVRGRPTLSRWSPNPVRGRPTLTVASRPTVLGHPTLTFAGCPTDWSPNQMYHFDQNLQISLFITLKTYNNISNSHKIQP